jgi:hypothetical protein
MLCRYLIASWPVRTISLSYDGELIASGSEESNIDIVII